MRNLPSPLGGFRSPFGPIGGIGLARYAAAGYSPVQVLDATGSVLIQLGMSLSFDRASVADRIAANLDYEQVAIDAARIQSDRLGVLPRGLLVEGAATRLNADPAATNADWSTAAGAGSKSAAGLAIWGEFTGVRAQSTGGVGYTVGPDAIAWSAATEYTVRAFYTEPASGSSGRARLQLSNGATSTNLLVSGAVGALSATTTNGVTGVSVTNTTYPGGIYAVDVTFTNTSTFTRQVGLGPDTSTSGDAVVALGIFVGQAGSITTEIFGTAADTVRADENATFAMSHGGGDFTIGLDWYQGVAPADGYPRVFQASPAAAPDSNRQFLYFTPSGDLKFNSFASGSTRGTAGSFGAGSVGRHRAIVAFSDGNVRASYDGGAVVTQAMTGSLPSVESLTLFNSALGANEMPGIAENFVTAVWDTALPDAALTAWQGAG